MAQHRILLADDSSTMHRAVKLALSRGDYDLICCDNGTDALRICKEVSPILLIADLDLPGISGAELIKAVKSDPNLAATKIVLLCSSIHQGDIGRLDKIAADARLWKPFESEALFTLVLALLRSTPARTSSTLSSASTQQMSRAAINPEATRPMNNPMNNPMNKASVLVDRTMPPLDKTPPPTSSPTSSHSPTETFPLTQKDLTENLWSPDFDAPPMTSESTGSREYTAKAPTKKESTENLSAYREATGQWESIQARPSSPTPPPPPRAAQESSAPAISSVVSKEEIRNMIRSEVQLAFDSWFKEKLETKLQEILIQIERESKSTR